MKDINSVRGALYGVAVGDALGAPLEFMRSEEIKAKYGEKPVEDMVGGGWLNVAPGEVTDDTQMTLAVAFGIFHEPEYPIYAIGQRFIAWADSNPKDIGGTCARSINIAKEMGGYTEHWYTASELVGSNKMSGGNGALMRTVYTGLYYPANEVEMKTAEIAEMTHHDYISTSCCMYYAQMIYRAVHGYGVITNIDSWLDLNDMPEKPTGWSKDSMNCALRSIWKTHHFKDAVVRAVNLGGDADTIGAITGGLAGAIYGASAIPEKWIRALPSKIKQNIEFLAKAAMQNE